MKLNRLNLCSTIGLVVIVAMPVLLPAQEPQKPTEGVNSGNYNVRQAVEFGYRFTDITGSQPTYETFVNFSDGPRVLEQMLQMRSLNHQGTLFDDLSLISFGYGGDPNAVSRLRMYKNKVYNFNSMFRMDRNRWDYNLLANPLNPLESNPAVPVIFSPHRMELVRRMSDYNLTLFPQSRVRFRAGYSRNIMEGPAFTTPRAGTETEALQSWKTTLNSYSFGMDFKVFPRTNISYDQFFHNYKGDNTWSLISFPYQLSDRRPVNLGIIFNTPANQPCSAPIADAGTTPPTASPTCNAYLSYFLGGNARTSYPTEQLTFQSNYFKNLDLAGRFSYSSSDHDVLGFQENFNGRGRNNNGEYVTTGPIEGKRVSVTSDFGLTWHFSDKLRLYDAFRFHHFRIPGAFDFNQYSLFNTSMLIPPNRFTPGSAPPANCPTPTSPGCPQHVSGSAADVISESFSRFLGQDSKVNQVEVAYDFAKNFGGRLGYRFRHRDITLRSGSVTQSLFFPTFPNRGACANEPLLPDGSCRASDSEASAEEDKINEHTGLLGLWLRPADGWRMNFDLELMSADESFTRISPRQSQIYKFRTRYQASEWLNLGFSVNIWEARNNVVEIFHKQHDRSYGFSAMISRSDRWGLDLGYDFNDIFSQTNICFTLGGQLPPGSSPCPVATSAQTTQALSFYNMDTHFGYFDLMFRPVRRVTARMGYTVSSTAGSTLILSPNSPPGPLQYNYHKPFGGLAFDMGRNLTLKGDWNYYGYNEKAPPDPAVGFRDFRGNMLTTSLRWAF
jgi:hypothetical protein